MRTAAAGSATTARRDLGAEMDGEGGEDDGSEIETACDLKLRILYEKTKKHESWLPRFEDDNECKLFSNKDRDELLRWTQWAELNLKNLESAMDIMTGKLKRDEDALARFRMTLAN